MNEIVIEQARFLREDNGTPWLAGRSPGFQEDWLSLAKRQVVGFGNRPPGQRCEGAVFAQPLGSEHVAIVQVTDRTAGSEAFFDRSLIESVKAERMSAAPAALGSASGKAGTTGFHFLVLLLGDYQGTLGDPFWLARRFPADWQRAGPFEALACQREPLPPRTVADVQKVLRRVKASALKEDQDPEAGDFERTHENSESPGLLGGVQALVEGGKLVFERPAPDNDLLAGLWTLLPNSTRARLWPASFAFANTLGFDAVVVPRVNQAEFEGYTSEEQAAEYPQGHYEMALQTAAESGNQHDLDRLLNRRSTGETIKLAWALLVVIAILALTPVFLDWIAPLPEGGRPPTEQQLKLVTAAGMIGVQDPWTAGALKLFGEERLGFPKAKGAPQ